MEREGYANLIALACFGAFGIGLFLVMLFCLQRYILFDNNTKDNTNNTNTNNTNTNTPLKDDLEQAKQHPSISSNNNDNNEREEEEEIGHKKKRFCWQLKWIKTKMRLLNRDGKKRKKAGAVAPESMALQQLELATSGFSPLNRLKTGHAGDIYSGVLDGERVVVKRFYLLPAGSTDLFEAEMAAHSKAAQACDRQQHRFLVPLLGRCVQGRERLLVYRRAANGDLAAALANGGRPCDAGSPEGDVSRALPWTVRLKIGLGLAKALAFLHHDCRPRLEHRNIEASSILLDKGFEVKLGSLTEVKILEDGEAPLYDMYCFGRVLLDLLSGLDVSGCTGTFAEAWMLKALPLIGAQNKKAFLQMIDPPLIIQLDQENIEQGIMGMALLAKSCITSETFKHLSMKAIYDMLRNPENITTML